MDMFLAAIRINASAADWTSSLEMLGKALQAVSDPETPTAQTHWSNGYIALAWETLDRASDTACSTADDRLMYINGPVSRLGTADAGEPAPFEGRYAERLSALSQAARAWLAGQAGLKTLSGSFCAVYHDAHLARTLVISDRLASRPIFYCTIADCLYIASDIRPLLRLPGFKPQLDLESVAQFIRYQMILDDRTLYSNIKVVPAGTVVWIDHQSGDYKLIPYWSLAAQPFFRTQGEAIEATAEAFKGATNRIVADSQKLGILLSGGFDSRMLLTSLDQANGPPLHAYTFGPAFTEESQVAHQVAQTCSVSWQFIDQPLAAYWEHLRQGVLASNGLHAAGHMHLYYPTSVMTQAGCDTVLNGWGFDLPYSGSYFPKETFRVLGRQLYTYRVLQINGQQAVVDHLHAMLDMQLGRFSNSLFGPQLRQHWECAPSDTLSRLVSRASTTSDSPYDWIDYTLMGFGVTKFRSYSMLMNVRAQARERNPLFESDIIEAYQRLPYQWRFLGHVFRRAVRQLNPTVANIPYSNIGISAFAPPAIQALAMQGRATLRANVARVQSLSQRMLGRSPTADAQPFGSYHESFEMARYLDGKTPIVRRVEQMLRSGPLVEMGILDPGQLQAALQRCHNRLDRSGFTLMAWVALALWLDAYPADLSIAA